MIVGVLLGLLAIGVLVAIHAFFVAAEFALVAADRPQVEELAKEGGRRARRAEKALETLSFQLSGAQLGITITSLLVGFLIEPYVAPLLEPVLEVFPFVPEGSVFAVSVTIGVLLATAVEMVVAELIPKNIAIARSTRVSLLIAGPLQAVNTALKPLIVFLNAAADRAVRLFGINPRDDLKSSHSLEELEVLIQSSREGGAISKHEYSLLSRSISFREKTASDALTPRVDMTSIHKDESLKAFAELAAKSGHSRLPVWGKGLDDIIGIAHIKDLFAQPSSKRPRMKVRAIMKEPFVAPESRTLISLLTEMRGESSQLAVIVDEYGGTAGILTLEDVMEEIVGEIEDEFDPLENRGPGEPEGVHLVDGSENVDDLFEEVGLGVPEGPYETLAGFLLHSFGRIPATGDHISYEGWEMKVVKMDGRRIQRVLIVSPAASARDTS